MPHLRPDRPGTNRGTRGRLALLCAVLVLAVTGCSRVDPSTLPPVPRISTGTLSKGVQEQINEAYAALDADPMDKAKNGRLAMILQTYRQYPDSAIMYERVRVLDPKTFKWAYFHGVVLNAIGKPVEAEAAYRRALALDGNYDLARMRLAQVLADQGKAEEARSLYEELLPRADEIPEAKYAYARFLVSEGEPERAIGLFKEVLKRSGDFGPLHFQFAMAYRAMGETDLAERHFRLSEKFKGLGADGNDPVLNELLLLNRNDSPFVTRARVLAQMGRLAEAEDFIMMALERNPESVSAYTSLIGLSTTLGDFEAVDENYAKAIAIDPDHPKTHYNFAIARMAQGRWAEAKEALERSLSADATDPNAQAQYAALLIQGGQTPLAEIEVHLRTALQYDPDHMIANALLGDILSRSGRPEEAIGHLLRAAEYDHEMRTSVVIGLAQAYAKMRDWDAALAELARAAALVGDDEANARTIGMLRAEILRLRSEDRENTDAP